MPIHTSGWSRLRAWLIAIGAVLALSALGSCSQTVADVACPKLCAHLHGERRLDCNHVGGHECACTFALPSVVVVLPDAGR